MKKRIGTLLIIALLVVLSGCSGGKLKGELPPEVTVSIDGQEVKAKLAVYDWHSESTKVGSYAEVMKGERAQIVDPKEEAQFNMDYDPKPSTEEICIVKDEKTSQCKKGNKIKSPTEKGDYSIEYTVDWKDGDENLGSATYLIGIAIR